MTETEKRQHRCCFTGHRPKKLTVPEKNVIALLEKEIRQTIADRTNIFITGMAPGVDIWAAEIIIYLRDSEHLPLKLIASNPYPNFFKRWSIDWQNRYAAVIKAADLTKDIITHYLKVCYQIRNEWMVNRSAKVIAVWNGKPSSTKNTIDYAKKSVYP